jgi:hypothetical protein
VLFQAKNSGNGTEDALLYHKVRLVHLFHLCSVLIFYLYSIKTSRDNDPIRSLLVFPSLRDVIPSLTG